MSGAESGVAVAEAPRVARPRREAGGRASRRREVPSEIPPAPEDAAKIADVRDQISEEAKRQRSEEIFRTRHTGSNEKNWLLAEKELAREARDRPAPASPRPETEAPRPETDRRPIADRIIGASTDIKAAEDAIKEAQARNAPPEEISALEARRIEARKTLDQILAERDGLIITDAVREQLDSLVGEKTAELTKALKAQGEELAKVKELLENFIKEEAETEKDEKRKKRLIDILLALGVIAVSSITTGAGGFRKQG